MTPPVALVQRLRDALNSWIDVRAAGREIALIADADAWLAAQPELIDAADPQRGVAAFIRDAAQRGAEREAAQHAADRRAQEGPGVYGASYVVSGQAPPPASDTRNAEGAPLDYALRRMAGKERALATDDTAGSAAPAATFKALSAPAPGADAAAGSAADTDGGGKSTASGEVQNSASQSAAPSAAGSAEPVRACGVCGAVSFPDFESARRWLSTPDSASPPADVSTEHLECARRWLKSEGRPWLPERIGSEGPCVHELAALLASREQAARAEGAAAERAVADARVAAIWAHSNNDPHDAAVCDACRSEQKLGAQGIPFHEVRARAAEGSA